LPKPSLIRIGVVGDLQELSMFGRSYSERYIEIAREERAASGKLRKDRIAIKKEFLLEYDTADQEVVDRLTELFELGDELELEVTHMETVKTYTVLMSPFEQARLLAVWGGLWEGVSMELREV